MKMYDGFNKYIYCLKCFCDRDFTEKYIRSYNGRRSRIILSNLHYVIVLQNCNMVETVV